MPSNKPADSIEQALAGMRRERDILKNRIKPSEEAYQHRMEEIDVRRQREQGLIAAAEQRAKAKFFAVVGEKHARIVEIEQMIASFENQQKNNVPLPEIRELAARIFGEEDDGFTAAELCRRIAAPLGVQTSAQFATRIMVALQSDTRFNFDEHTAKFTFEGEQA